MGSAGHHAESVPPSHVANFLKVSDPNPHCDTACDTNLVQLLVAIQVSYGVSVGLVKISICLFYIRIFFTKNFRTASWILIGTIASWSLVVVFTAFFICTPLAANWDSNIPGGKCHNQTAAYTGIGVIDLVTDIAIFILPIPMIWNLQVSTGNRVALFAVFGLGTWCVLPSVEASRLQW